MERGEDCQSMVEEGLLGLCRLGSEQNLLPNLRRVRFSSRRGNPVVGCLFVPARPSGRALIFGHGGFGFKESWLDVMEEVTRRTGCYTLALDFEGCGESGGWSSWRARIDDFSAAMDFLEKSYQVHEFALGGHSGGGAYPAACAALEDTRASVLVLWDCIFDFYDTHLAESAPDPGGNPAALLEQTLSLNRGKRVVATEVFAARKVEEHLDEIYEEIDATLSHFRHPSALLGKAQKTRKLAILHVTAEDVLQQVGPEPRGQTFRLAPAQSGPVRARFLGRQLAFHASGLFNRPSGMWDGWRRDLGESTRFIVIPGTTHAFEAPGRQQAIQETVDWIQQHLGAKAHGPTTVDLPVRSPSVRLLSALPAASKGVDVQGFEDFPNSVARAVQGKVRLAVSEDPVYVLDGDTSVGSVEVERSPFGIHPAVVPDNPDGPFARARQLGVRWHRGIYAYWIKIQPTAEDVRRGIFHWETTDREWGAVPKGMNILANIGLPERLKDGPGPLGTPFRPPTTWKLNLPETDYVTFVKAVVERYDGDGKNDMPGLKVPVKSGRRSLPPSRLDGAWLILSKISQGLGVWGGAWWP